MIKFTTSVFAILTVLQVSAQGGAAINTTGTPANPSAILDISSTNAGILIPRMTTAERNAITNPAQGLLILNTTTNCFETFLNPIWQSIFCGCTLPSTPTAGTQIPSSTEITWNWNTVAGATGYKYNTINNYASATDNGGSTTYTQPGLTCNTLYTLYIWAYSSCGNSSTTTLNQTTSSCFACGANVTFTYKGSSVTYGTVTGQNNTCWLNRNLGATDVATAYNHSNGYGDFFQWGRLDDGHQTRSSNTTTTLSTTDIPGHTQFIANSTSPFDWRNPQNNNLWQGTSGVNNPCPTGWRLPTETELDSERASWGSNQNYNGAIASPQKFTAAGWRGNGDGAIGFEASRGNYWSSTLDGTAIKFLVFANSFAGMSSASRAFGSSVRCVKD